MVESRVYKEYCERISSYDIHGALTRILGERYAQYRKAWDSATPESIPDFPVHVDFELFDKCNQSCSFCPRNEDLYPDVGYPINSDATIPEDVINRLVAEAKEESLYSVNFSFGEPLLYKGLFNTVKRFHEEGGVVDSRVITNGLLLHRHMEELFDSGLVNLFVSLDAFSKATYNRQRGYGYKKVVDNLLGVVEEKKLRGAVLPMIRVSFVRNGENEHELDDFIRFWRDKVDIIDIQTCLDYNAADNGADVEKKWTCIDPFRRMSVLATGEVLPCCTFFGKKLVIGDTRIDSLKRIWNSGEMRWIRKSLLDDSNEVCRSCQSA